MVGAEAASTAAGAAAKAELIEVGARPKSADALRPTTVASNASVDAPTIGTGGQIAVKCGDNDTMPDRAVKDEDACSPAGVSSSSRNKVRPPTAGRLTFGLIKVAAPPVAMSFALRLAACAAAVRGEARTDAAACMSATQKNKAMYLSKSQPTMDERAYHR